MIGAVVEADQNQSRCPHEKAWYCELLGKACHPGMNGCVLGGIELADALIAFEEKAGLISPEEGS